MEILKLVPECKDNIWGGVKLKEKYGKKTDKDPVAESWELSFHKDGPTRLENGKTLQETVTAKELGKNCDGFPFFPMLVKLIDAKQDLSVQVHPSDAYALKNENSFGKTEMWYIVEADEGAKIYLGFKKDVSQEEYEAAIKNNTLIELLNAFEVQAGDCYFIPSGTIHAIGTGCLICEIQQNSNLTYRVYDYGRKDKNGKERELHVEKALKVTNLSKYEYKPLRISTQQGELLGLSRYFTTTSMAVDGEVCVHTIGDQEPVGLCGSGLMDAIAALLEIEELDETGSLETDPYPLAENAELTQADIRAVQLAKAAICAGMVTLLKTAGCDPEEVQKFYVAGGFGSHASMDSAAKIGMIPDVLAEKVKVLGNAALRGAVRLLTLPDAKEKAQQIAASSVHVALGGNARFNDAYIEAMMFPEQE